MILQSSILSGVMDHQIKKTTWIEDFFQNYGKYILKQSLSEHLSSLLKQKELRKADVVRGSLLDRQYVYQIFSGEKTPSRDKLLAIAFGLNLTLKETQKMLKVSKNRELYARDQRDAIIMFTLQQQGNIDDVNILLDRYGCETLGITSNSK